METRGRRKAVERIAGEADPDAVLRERERRLEDAQRLAHIGLWELDPTDNSMTWSDETHRIFEFDPLRVEATFTAFLAAIHPDDRERVDRACRDSIDNRTSYDVRPRLLLPDGRIKWVHVRGETEFSAEGAPLISRGTVQDITVSALAEEALRHSEEKFRAVAEATPVPTLITRKSDGRILFANAAAAKNAGMDPADLLGESTFLMWQGSRSERRRFVRTLESAGQLQNQEVLLRFPDGTQRWLLLSAQPIDFEGQDAIFTSYTDITDRKEAEQSLALSEQRFRSVFQHAPAGLVLKDLKGRTQLVNAAYEKMLQTTADQVIGRTTHDLYDKSTADRLVALDERIRRYKVPIAQEMEMHLPALGECWMHFVKFPVFDSHGEVTGIGGFGIDITDRKLVEQAMRVISSQLITLEGHTYWHASVSAVAELLKADIAFVCRADPAKTGKFDILSYVEDGKPASDVSPAFPDRLWKDVVDQANGGVFMVERSLSARYPEVRYFAEMGIESTAAAPMTDAGGQTFGILGVMKRTSRFNKSVVTTVLNLFAVAVAAEMTRERNRRQYGDLFEFAPEALLLVDQSGRIRLANKQAEDVFGWTRAEMRGQLVEMLTPAGTRAGHAKMRADFSASPNRHRMATERRTLQGQRKDGTTFPAEIDLAPVETEGGMMIAAAVRDITARRRLEAQLTQAQKMEAVGQLTGGIAHDFNNLLAIINGNGELIAELDNPETERLIRPVLHAARRGAQLTQRLLAFSRQQTLWPQAIDTAALIDGMSEMLGRALGETITIRTTIEPDIWNAWADPGQLENAVLNLAINARDALPDGGTLTITCANAPLGTGALPTQPELPAGQYVSLQVRDDGKGIPSTILARVFDPFFTTKGVGQGSGLGLSMVYGFAKQSGGAVTIDSKPERGTTVTLYLPKALHDHVAAEPDSFTEIMPGHGENVLVIEDDEDVRELSVQILVGHGYDVIDVENAEAARQVLANGQPVDIVVSDVVLTGGTSGPEFAAEVRQANPGIKFVFMSGYTEEAVGPDLTLFPDAVLLKKPFQNQLLVRTVRETLDA